MSRLVLTRKVNEEVVVHDYGGVITTLKITKVAGNQVRIAFDANEEVYIDRKKYTNKNYLKIRRRVLCK